ncbi:MAG: prepilin-type cleavage/methylation domain-containing protein [Burkholderiaceae bacterium]|nr:MAG: prepilin-type cleavage/methylation domain-containing protein [Burkholderiaceae bacterium]
MRRTAGVRCSAALCASCGSWVSDCRSVASSAHFRERGLTLVELLVAMLIGLFLIVGMGSIFLMNQQTYRTSSALANVEDGSRIAFELMARDIRSAGSTGCDSTSGRVANVLNDQSIDWWANWNNALRGYGGSQADPAVATGSGVGQRVANTDSIEIVGAGNSLASIAKHDPNAASMQLNAVTPALYPGAIIVICSPDHAAITQVSSYNSSNVTLVHNTGNTFSPGNCSKGLGYPTDCTTTNGNSYAFTPNSSISMLSATDWYIGNNPVGGRSLYRIALAQITSGGTGMAAQAQEIVRNVTDMQITYLQRPNTSFIDASAVTDWGPVIAAHVQLQVESGPNTSTNGNQPIIRTFEATTTVRNRTN